MNFWSTLYLLCILAATILGFVRFCQVMDDRAVKHAESQGWRRGDTHQLPHYSGQNKAIIGLGLIVWLATVLGQFLTGSLWTVVAIVISLVAMAILGIVAYRTDDKMMATGATFLGVPFGVWAFCSLARIDFPNGCIIGLIAGIVYIVGVYGLYKLGRGSRARKNDYYYGDPDPVSPEHRPPERPREQAPTYAPQQAPGYQPQAYEQYAPPQDQAYQSQSYEQPPAYQPEGYPQQAQTYQPPRGSYPQYQAPECEQQSDQQPVRVRRTERYRYD